MILSMDIDIMRESLERAYFCDILDHEYYPHADSGIRCLVDHTWYFRCENCDKFIRPEDMDSFCPVEA